MGERSDNSVTSSRLDGIEALRAIAALMIVLYHMVLLPNPNIELPTYLSFIKEKFGLGVPLFYALSGFVLAHGYIDRLDNRESIRRFYIRRFFRIAPLFYVMMVVWLVGKKIKWGANPISFQEIVLNLLFVFGLAPGSHESIVWAGWSIGVEMIFYLLFPIVATLIRSVASAILGLAICITAGSAFYGGLSHLAVGSYAYLNVVTHSPNFLVGILAYFIWKATGEKTNKVIGLALFGLAMLCAYTLNSLPGALIVLATAKGINADLYAWCFVFLFAILSICFWPNAIVVNKATTFLGRISFSIYLLHPLVIVLLLRAYTWTGTTTNGLLVNLILCALITLAVLIPLAIASFKFIETPGIAYGKKITSPA
jgi:peptidoglycan/LPS O-acetylase OafA/YrhL